MFCLLFILAARCHWTTGPERVSVSGDSFVVTGDDRCLHIVTRVGGSLQETHSVTLPQPQGVCWESAVQLPGPLYAVLDYAFSGRVVCVDREGEVRHTVYSRDTSPGYQDLSLPSLYDHRAVRAAAACWH